MPTLLVRILAFFRDEDGVTLTEYALTLVLILVVTLGAISVLGSNLSALFQAASSSI